MNAMPASSLARIWSDSADALADWSLSRIFVRRDVFGKTGKDGKRITGHDPVTRDLLIRHYQGSENIGAHLISPDNLCLCLIADVDAHDDKADHETNWQCVNLIADTLGKYDLNPLICDSNGNGGYHVREFFKKPVASNVVAWLASTIRARLKATGLPDVEIFPKQDEVSIQTPYGNWVRLPGKHHKREHYTRILIKGDWLDGEAAIKALIRVAGDTPAKLLSEFNAQQPKSPQRSKLVSRSTDDEYPDAIKVREALKYYVNADVHYDEWIGIGMALNSWDSQGGLDEWREWSKQSTKYVDGTCETKWQSFSPNGKITVRSLFKAAIDRGWKPGHPENNGHAKNAISTAIAETCIAVAKEEPLRKKDGAWTSCLKNSEIWLMSQPVGELIRYDTFRQTILIDDQLMSDELVVLLKARIESETRAAWNSEYIREALILIAGRNQFSSLREWLDGLEWDGEYRVNTFFNEAYGVVHTPYAGECSRVLFLSAVARAYRPGCQADVMVVLIGSQGVGKSMGVASLSPKPEWYADDLGCDLTEGKAGEGLQGKWLFEFSEFARVNRATLDTVKSFVSRRVDHYRPPYGRISRDFPRSCVFIGTTNDPHPLRDVENRRFMPISCSQGIISWITQNREQLWAEAVHRFKQGEKWWADDPEIASCCLKAQEAARMDDAWEMILEERLAGREETTLEEAADKLGIKPDKLDKSTQIRIGIVLSTLDFRRKRVQEDGKRGYRYVRKLPEHEPAF